MRMCLSTVRRPRQQERTPAQCPTALARAQRAFFVEISVTCHLATGRSQAMLIPLQLGHRRGDLGAASPASREAFPDCFSPHWITEMAVQ